MNNQKNILENKKQYYVFIVFKQKNDMNKNNHKHKIIINHIKKNTILNVKLFAIYFWKKTQLVEIKIVKKIE